MAIILRYPPNRMSVDDLEGKTVGEVRAIAEELLSIPTGATASVNGETVNNEHRLQSGDELLFNRSQGEKGQV